MRLAIVLVVCGLAGSAMGQYNLDNNLQVGAGKRNPAGRDLKQELQFRNAIVTGNAPGGISFRGDVGYRAPGEFFGSLGSNDTFTFRRDSAYSGLAGMGIRGTDALQYQFAVTTGNAPPPSLTGVPVFGRSGSSATLQQIESSSNTTVRRDGLGVARYERDDTRGLGLMSMRSPSAYIANQSLQPTVLGRTEHVGGYKAVTASMLRGVSYDDLDALAPGRNEPTKPPPRPGALPSTGIDGSAPATAIDRGVTTTTVHSGYDDLLERMQKSAPKLAEGTTGPRPGEAGYVPDWERRLMALRAELAEQQKKAKPATEPAPDPKPKPPEEGKEDEQPPTPTKMLTDPETIDLIRGASDKIRTLAPESFDAYGTQMRAAQGHLTAGRYFDAEERFAAALSARPGDPLASVGRIHAQMGSGMFLSASINLRGLLTQHPELAGTKYDATLLPAADRLGVVMDRLREQASRPGGRDAGLLLAYMGHQIGDRDAMAKGLDVASKDGSGDQLERLAGLLKRVWSEEAPPK